MVLEYSLDDFSIFQKACNSESSCFLVVVLKFGQSQSHVFNVGNVRTVSSYLTLEKILELVELEKDSRFTYKDLIKKEEMTY